MKNLIEDLKKVIVSNIDETDKWCERLIVDYIKERESEALNIPPVIGIPTLEVRKVSNKFSEKFSEKIIQVQHAESFRDGVYWAIDKLK